MRHNGVSFADGQLLPFGLFQCQSFGFLPCLCRIAQRPLRDQAFLRQPGSFTFDDGALQRHLAYFFLRLAGGLHGCHCGGVAGHLRRCSGQGLAFALQLFFGSTTPGQQFLHFLLGAKPVGGRLFKRLFLRLPTFGKIQRLALSCTAGEYRRFKRLLVAGTRGRRKQRCLFGVGA